MERLNNRQKKYRRLIIFIFGIIVLFTLLVLASDVAVIKIKEGDVEYLYFELEHNLTNAQYKYYGYGYTVTVYDNNNKVIGSKYLPNADFIPTMNGSKEIVKISIEKIFDKLSLDKKYYYRNGCYIYLNGRLGIRVNEKLTRLYDSYNGVPAKGINYLQGGYASEEGVSVPVNKDLKGIANGIEHEYGVSWSAITKVNLDQHFGIEYSLAPVFLFDGYEVKYEEADTKKQVSKQKPIQNFGTTKIITEYPESINGYKYNGKYKIEKTDTNGNVSTIKDTTGDSATVNLAKASSIYTITFYYTKDTGNGGGSDPGSEGSGDIMVYVWYKEKDTNNTLLPLKKVNTSLGKYLIESAAEVKDYKSTSVTIKGKATKTFTKNNINELVGLYDYSKPVDGYLDVTFYYEKSTEKPSDNWCDPQFDARSQDARKKMKRSDFEKADEIYFDSIYIFLDDFEGGWKRISGTEWKEIPGTHNFEYFDLYLKYPGATGYDYIRHGIYSKSVYQSINMPKSKFTPNNPENTEYIATVEATLGVNCSCGGFSAEKTYPNLIIEIEENMPPEAFYRYATIKTLPDGTERREYSKAYVGKDVIIENYCDDPNGLTDIKNVKFIFKNINNPSVVREIGLNMTAWKEYVLDKTDNFDDTSIIFYGFKENGSINLEFKNTEEWEVTVYVEDTEGLNDSYTEVIKPEILSLKPIAVIKDTYGYRYPNVAQEFNGKQNRVAKLDSNNSYVAAWLRDMNVTIDHSRDMWQIEPVDGQDINSVKFEREINKIMSGNLLNARYEHLNIKMMFKEVGRYKIRLQVTDTEGNVSDWMEQIITIHPDLEPVSNANISSKFYRNTNAVASLFLRDIVPSSLDMDNAFISSVGYKYDSNNNGSFDDENVTAIQYNNENSVTIQTSKLGKYQFIIVVKETFGQETMAQFLEEKDYRIANIKLVTEVDNISPDVTLFKIMTTEE